MQRLSRDEVGLAAPLFAGLEHHLALQAVLGGRLDAPIYLDNLPAPRMAFTWIQSRAFVGGAEPGEGAPGRLHALLEDQVWPTLAAADEDVLVFHEATGPWDGILAQALAPYGAERYPRLCFSLRELKAEEICLPPGFILRLVDADLLADETLRGRQVLIEEMLSERPSVEAFLRESFGVCPVYDSAVAGWCLSEYNTADRCEVGIAVAEEHRRQGVATALTAAFVGMARERGIREVGWHCWAGNVASAATARKAGFTLEREYAVYVAYLRQR